MKKIFSIILLFVFIGNQLYAGDAGQESLFTTGAGARALGMGGAFTAVASDASAIYYNPAGLASLQNHEISFMHATFFEGTQYNYTGWVYPSLKLGGFGVGLMRVGTDGITRRNNYIDIGEFGFYNLQVLISYGYNLHEKFSLGLSFKYLYQSIDSYSDYGLGLDFGLKARLTRHWYFGIIARDLIPAELKLISSKETTPMSVSSGLAYSNSYYDNKLKMIAALDIEKNENRSTKVHVGTETIASDKYSLRMGYDRDNLSFGLGYLMNNLKIDYTYKALDFIDDSHRFSISFLIGSSIDERKAVTERKQEIFGTKLIIDEKAKSFELYKAKADTYFYSMQLDSALVFYNRALAFDEENEEILEIINSIEYTLKNTELTKLGDIKKDLEIKTSIGNYYLQANNFYFKKYYLAALDMLGLIFEINPVHKDALELKVKIENTITQEISSHLNIAREAKKSADYITAIEAFTEILQLDPNNREARHEREAIGAELNLSQQLNQGIELYKNNKFEDARRTFMAVIAVYPNEPVALEYLKKMQPADEEQTTLRDLQEDKDAWKLYLDGLRYMRNEEYTKAIEAWEKVLKKYPLSRETRSNLEQARLRLNSEESNK